MEWNDSALVVIFLLFLVPVVIVYVSLQWTITRLSGVNKFIIETKKNHLILYIIIQIGLAAVSVGLAVVLLRTLVFIKGSGLLT